MRMPLHLAHLVHLALVGIVVAAAFLAGCGEEAEVPEGVPGLPGAAKKAAVAPRLGDKAPAFKAESTSGEIDFPAAYKGRWVVLFGHPGDFSPVCTTEFMQFAAAKPKFDALQCDLLAVSADSVDSHMSWLKEVRGLRYGELSDVKVDFPVLADPALEIAKSYGMVHPKTLKKAAVRTLFVIDPGGKVRATIAYPPTIGRSIPEVLRLVTALQTSDYYDVATPADWQPGDDVILKPLATKEANVKRSRHRSADYYSLAWFLCLKRLSDPERALKRAKWPAK
ncbi:MAG: peroxiredoxin [Planctomycetota bacterium]